MTGTAPPRLRTLLICHNDAPLHRDGMARWLASWSDLTGVVAINEPRNRLIRRIQRERRRVGLWRLLDVVLFRAYYRFGLAARDRAWVKSRLRAMQSAWPVPSARSVSVVSPNSAESQAFIVDARPDLVIALCKHILADRIFTIARFGTFVLHPGIAPEYRNAHGCFWALASDDLDRVGLSLIRIDKGIDTGPVFGYFHGVFDEVEDSHIKIQHQLMLDNLDAIQQRLLDVVANRVEPENTSGRVSAEWGQPWLSAYLRWKRRARRRRARDRA